jgi:WD40 repeat protein
LKTPPQRSRQLSAVVMALAALGALGAMALDVGHGSAAGQDRDDLPPYHSPNPIREPRLFAEGVVCTGDYESYPAFAPGGRTLYFVKSTPDDRLGTIVYTRFADGGWTIPRVASFSGKFADADPFIAPDGKKLYYASRRPPEDYIGAEGVDNMNLWVVDRVTDTTWSVPKSLGPAVNGPANETFPTLAADGTLYFASDRAGGKGGVDLWRSRLVSGAYGAPENLGDSVNTAANEIEPLIAPDQSWLVFAARGRADGRGGADLYVSRPRAAGWSRPRDLGDPIDSPEDDFSPHLSPDGEYFFWTSCRSFADQPADHALQYNEFLGSIRRVRNGLGDLYQIDLKALDLAR